MDQITLINACKLLWLSGISLTILSVGYWENKRDHIAYE